MLYKFAVWLSKVFRVFYKVSFYDLRMFRIMERFIICSNHISMSTCFYLVQ